jgi:hypothetical protein
MSNHHVCPWWLAYTFDNPLRRLIHNPRKILSGYVKERMTVKNDSHGCRLRHGLLHPWTG